MTNVSNKLFSVTPKQFSVGNANFEYPEVKPTNSGGYIDIVKEYAWKNNTSSNVEEVPSVVLEEYTLSYGKWANGLAAVAKNLSNAVTAGTNGKNVIDPYGTLYFGNRTGFKYTLPYIVKPGTSIRGDTNNQWNELDDPVGEVIGKMPLIGASAKKGYDSIANVLELVGGFVSPGYGQEKVMQFGSTQRRSIVISFPLYNTISVDDAIKNHSFVQLITIQNLKTRTSFLTYIPPKLYTVDSFALGGVYMPAAFISNLKIDSIGTTRRIYGYSGVGGSNNGFLIPEAYRVSITLTEVISESSNIMMGAIGGDKVSVIAKPPDRPTSPPPATQPQTSTTPVTPTGNNASGTITPIQKLNEQARLEAAQAQGILNSGGDLSAGLLTRNIEQANITLENARQTLANQQATELNLGGGISISAPPASTPPLNVGGGISINAPPASTPPLNVGGGISIGAPPINVGNGILVGSPTNLDIGGRISSTGSPTNPMSLGTNSTNLQLNIPANSVFKPSRESAIGGLSTP